MGWFSKKTSVVCDDYCVMELHGLISCYLIKMGGNNVLRWLYAYGDGWIDVDYGEDANSAVAMLKSIGLAKGEVAK